ncbi:Antitoxin VbhA domain-containing protein [Candidatus Electrothrix gigas]
MRSWHKKLVSRMLRHVKPERFVALIQREPFDYTKWREELDEEGTIEEISRKAMALRKK